MKTFVFDIIPKLERFSKMLDDLTLIKDKHWIAIDNNEGDKTTYIFRSNEQLLISQNGLVDKGSWAHVGNKSILLDTNDGSFLLNLSYIDESVLALRLDNSKEFAVFVNENAHIKGLTSLNSVKQFLSLKLNEPNTSIPLELASQEGDVHNPTRNDNKPQFTDGELLVTILVVVMAILLVIFIT